MKYALLSLLAIAAFGQSIDAGSTSDQFFVGGGVWKPGVTGYEPLGDPPFDTLRYGTAFSYVFDVEPGFYRVRLRMIEPNKTGAGMRRFQVTTNGVSSGTIDLFERAGLKVPYVLDQFAVVNDGKLTIAFRGLIGNAVVSAIDVSSALVSGGPVSLESILVDRGGYEGPMIPAIGVDGKLFPATLLNGSTAEWPRGSGIPNTRGSVAIYCQ